jgi:hypothetical protein
MESTVSCVWTATTVHVGSTLVVRGGLAGLDASGPAAAAVTDSTTHATQIPIDRTTSSCGARAAADLIRRIGESPLQSTARA